MVEMKKLGVIGNPIKHSLSPEIHTIFAREHGIDISYTKIESTIDSFNKDVEEFFQNDGIGLNITLPFKEMAYNLSDEPDNHSRKCESCNTLLKKNGNLQSFSTDGLGFLKDLSNNKINLENTSILILGAGGSAKSIIKVLDDLKLSSTQLSIYNRTESKVEEILDKYKTSKNIIKFDNKLKYDLIINCTSVNIIDDVICFPPNIFKDKSVAYDLFYSNKDTKFEEWAKQCGAEKTINGIGMLIEQAALSYNIWNDFMPTTSTVKSKIGY